MNLWYLAAAATASAVAIAHSVLGEIMILRGLRSHGIVPTEPAPPLRSRNIRIIWASWHVVSVFGFAFAAILVTFAAEGDVNHPIATVLVLSAAFLTGAALVLVATRGRHPGWIGLLAAAAFTGLGAFDAHSALPDDRAGAIVPTIDIQGERP